MCHAAAACQSFNPRAPHGARRLLTVLLVRLREFQSTRPARGATRRALSASMIITVSIHAPRTGRDNADGFQQLGVLGFNPRAPHGARQAAVSFVVMLYKFQSTRPARGATDCGWKFSPVEHVSIHAPRTGRDTPVCALRTANRRFNPRAPHGARLINGIDYVIDTVVSIHAPRTGRDLSLTLQFTRRIMFQSTRPARGATTSSPWP